MPRQILQGYKRKGKKYIPPLIYMSGGEQRYTSYIDYTLPEILWVGILNYKMGIKKTALHLKELGDSLGELGIKENIIFQSLIKKLSLEQKQELLKLIQKKGIADSLRVALNDFVYLYPKSELSFLFNKEPSKLNDKMFIHDFKKMLHALSASTNENFM